ncbi:MAG: tyrosine--tRNA ligase [Phycisphaerae bacterium]|jgi:tyrosyl-tRNA synthetase|nr:tyrosine--tRNA ligase [Phycisphaerae bacterium]MCZ2399535.1 tyrosine--tRNA ligase [Phycisphaerae bacterium]
MSDLGLARLLDGCEHVYSEQELKHKLERAARDGRPLRVKLGMDPTAPDIHLGHCVVLGKMRQFQDLGHRAVLIIGDFTARIGDPTGRSKTRPVLTDDEIRTNAQTYLDQAGKVLDTHADKLEVRCNSEWLDGMNFAEVIRLAARMTVGQMLKRDDFRKRFESETPISIHELLYPLVQGWDSVNIRADVELGGTDQTYNNLVGRELQADAGQEPQVVMIMPILRGTDGVKKMSKSLGNYIAVTDTPRDVFGKTMSIPDDCLAEWFSLLTRVPEPEFRAAIAEHPMRAKALLARRIGERFHSAEEMQQAADWWREHFSAKRSGDAVEVRVPPDELENGRLPAWKLAWLAHEQEISRSEARRMVEGGAFEYDGQKITDPNTQLAVRPGATFRAGRHRKGERIKQPLLAMVVLG